MRTATTVLAFVGAALVLVPSLPVRADSWIASGCTRNIVTQVYDVDLGSASASDAGYSIGQVAASRQATPGYSEIEVEWTRTYTKNGNPAALSVSIDLLIHGRRFSGYPLTGGVSTSYVSYPLSDIVEVIEQGTTNDAAYGGTHNYTDIHDITSSPWSKTATTYAKTTINYSGLCYIADAKVSFGP